MVVSETKHTTREYAVAHLDAIRLALYGAASPDSALRIIHAILEDAPYCPPGFNDTLSPHLLLKALQNIPDGFALHVAATSNQDSRLEDQA